jgi:predicted NUDIX family phosphoesterase
MSGEQVLVVDRHAVPDGAGWHGLRTDGLAGFLATVAGAGYFVDRAEAEHDPARKQLIPYVVVTDGDRIFLMRRTRAGGDARLHDRWSIGVGGHVNPVDVDLDGGLRREWEEELITERVPRFRAVALLNDDTTDVGSVHLGVVYLADVVGMTVRVRETDKLEGTMADATAVRAVLDRLETWSRIVFEDIVAGSLAEGAAG